MKQSIQNEIDFLTSFQHYLHLYIQEKEALFRQEARDAGRGLTWRKLFNPIALGGFIGAFHKNPDHQSALAQRAMFLMHAHYMLANINRIIEAARQNPSLESLTIDFPAFYAELAAQLQFLTQAGCHGQYLSLLTDTINFVQKKFKLKNAIALSINQQAFYKLWPLFIAVQDTDTMFDHGDYSAQKAYQIYARDSLKWLVINGEEQSLETIFATTLKALNDEYRYTAPAAVNEIFDTSVDDETSFRLSHTLQVFKNKPISLSPLYRLSDGIMNMQLNPKRFARFTLTHINDQGVFNGKYQLPDGWYQFVILAKAPYQHQMRYFPCQNKNGAYLPYRKYVAHSEIAGGEPVNAAGNFKISNGKITVIDNSSGHYRNNNLIYTREKIRSLGDRGIDRADLEEAQPLTFCQMLKKLQRKLASFFYSLWSSRNNDLYQYAEKRPIPPQSLQGEHLHHSRTLLYSNVYQKAEGIFKKQLTRDRKPVNSPVYQRKFG